VGIVLLRGLGGVDDTRRTGENEVQRELGLSGVSGEGLNHSGIDLSMVSGGSLIPENTQCLLGSASVSLRCPFL
jgi:hypothetical protein